MIRDHDTIAAPATAAGGALAVIRISGEEALRICDRIFRGRKPLAAAAGYTVHYGEIVDDGRVLDDVLVTVFRAPRSYTGEDAAEISCHGSQYIVSEILRLLTDQRKNFTDTLGAMSTLSETVNKVLKDMIVKARQLKGMDAHYVPGWDCHGLPIENAIEKLHGRHLSRDEMQAKSRAFATEQIAQQMVDLDRKSVV